MATSVHEKPRQLNIDGELQLFTSPKLDGTWNTHLDGSASLLCLRDHNNCRSIQQKRVNVMIYLQVVSQSHMDLEKSAFQLRDANPRCYS